MAGLALHKLIAHSVFFSKAYFRLLTPILKSLPDNHYKKKFLNSINSVRWPDIDLPAQSIEIQKVKFQMVPHLGEFDLSALFMRELEYESSVFSFLKQTAKSYDAIIEIGANVGIYTLFFSFMNEKSNIYAFEPSRKAYQRLLKNLEINRRRNVNVFNAAVGESTGLADFYEPEGHLTNGSLRREFASIFSSNVFGSKTLKIGGDILQTIFEENKTVLLKIDAEGSETLILSSLMPILRRYQPDILVECLQIYEEEMNRLDLLDFYTAYLLTNEGAVIQPRFTGRRERDYFLRAKKV